MTQTANSVDSAGTAVPSNTSVTNPSTQMDENTFLKLLVAQLKYQDPMSPTDNQQFMQEQAQFSTVEGINNLQTTMKAVQAQQELSQSVALIGKQVSYVGSDGTLSSGIVSSVTSADGSLTVSVGGNDVDPSTIVNVADAPASGSDDSAALDALAKLLAADLSSSTGTDTTSATTTDTGSAGADSTGTDSTASPTDGAGA